MDTVVVVIGWILFVGGLLSLLVIFARGDVSIEGAFRWLLASIVAGAGFLILLTAGALGTSLMFWS